MTQRPNRVFVPRVCALGHLGHVVLVDPNDPKTHPSRHLPLREIPAHLVMTQMTQAHQVANHLAANP
jgi:hypothetical protein